VYWFVVLVGGPDVDGIAVEVEIVDWLVNFVEGVNSDEVEEEIL
jgi:hypothetical protein